MQAYANFHSCAYSPCASACESLILRRLQGLEARGERTDVERMQEAARRYVLRGSARSATRQDEERGR
jgi:hypothetical protein